MRRFSLVASVVLLVVAGASAAVAQTRVSFWHNAGGYEGELFVKIAEDFSRTNPSIKVEPTFVSGAGRGGLVMQDKLMVAIAAGTPPDVAHFNRHSTPSWAARGALMPITKWVKEAGITPDQFLPFTWKEANYKGETYALPFDTDGRALYYNRKLFRDVGLNPDKPPKSIAELDDAAEKLTKRGTGPSRYERIGFIPWMNQGLFYTWVLSFGGKLYDEQKNRVTATDPKIIAALEWVVSYAKKYDIAAIDTFSSAFGTQTQDPFVMGLVAMTVDGDWTISSLQRYAPGLDYGVTPTPYPPGGEETSYAGGWSLVVPQGAKRPKEGFEFAKYFTSADRQIFYCKNSLHIPTNKQASLERFLYEDPRHKVFMDVLPKSYGRPYSVEIDLLKQEDAINYDLVRHFKKTPLQAMQDLSDKVNKELEKWK